MRDKTVQIIISGIMGTLAIILGAFGAHVVKGYISDKLFETFQTAAYYQLVHSVVLLVLAISSRKFFYSFIFICAGLIIFCFSLYFYSLTGNKAIAIVAPVGGFSFILGWIFIIIEAIKDTRN